MQLALEKKVLSKISMKNFILVVVSVLVCAGCFCWYLSQKPKTIHSQRDDWEHTECLDPKKTPKYLYLCNSQMMHVIINDRMVET